MDTGLDRDFFKLYLIHPVRPSVQLDLLAELKTGQFRWIWSDLECIELIK